MRQQPSGAFGAEPPFVTGRLPSCRHGAKPTGPRIRSLAVRPAGRQGQSSPCPHAGRPGRAVAALAQRALRVETSRRSDVTEMAWSGNSRTPASRMCPSRSGCRSNGAGARSLDSTRSRHGPGQRKDLAKPDPVPDAEGTRMTQPHGHCAGTERRLKVWPVDKSGTTFRCRIENHRLRPESG